MIANAVLVLGVIVDAVMLSWTIMMTFSDDFTHGIIKGTWRAKLWLVWTLVFMAISLVQWTGDHPGHELVGAARGLEQWCNALMSTVSWRLTDKLVQQGKHRR